MFAAVESSLRMNLLNTVLVRHTEGNIRRRRQALRLIECVNLLHGCEYVMNSYQE
jgi:hypothetical protein